MVVQQGNTSQPCGKFGIQWQYGSESQSLATLALALTGAAPTVPRRATTTQPGITKALPHGEVSAALAEIAYLH